MDDLTTLTIAQLASLIAAREISPVELVDSYLARIDACSELNAFITLTPDAARENAERAERELNGAAPRSPLHGIPLAHKDIVDIKGVPTTCGSRVLSSNVPDFNAPVINALASAGAISLGKLNMNEFATILPSEHFGPTVNPWSKTHTPGGSSSGSGVAVAAGLCAGALGTDTGGSIRLPATYCGITGLKATFGRVSNRGVVPLAWSLDHIGPMTRSAEDCALIFGIIAGFDPQDLASRDEPVDTCLLGNTDSLQGVKLAVPESFFPEHTDAAVAAATDAALDVLRHLGATVETIPLDRLEQAWPIAEKIICAEASTWHARYLDEIPDHYGAKVGKFLSRAREITAQDYVTARGEKAQFKRDVLTALTGFDALIVPGALTPAPPLGARTLLINGNEMNPLPAMVGATCPFNLTGQPVLSLPTGFSAENLPLGIQIVGQPWGESTVLRIGAAFQNVTTWHQRIPSSKD